MNEPTELSIGRRVAALRKLRGLTQAGLAARLHRSPSWVTKIERGERPFDSMAVLVELSQVLGVSVVRLTGQDDPTPGVPHRHETADLTELRRIMDWPASMGVDNRPSLRPAVQVHRDAVALVRRHGAARHGFSVVLPRLPNLIYEAQSAAVTDSAVDRRLAHAALGMLYHLASAELDLWGRDMPRARVAMERALSSATYADDPLLLASIVAVHTLQLIRQGDAAEAVAVAVENADLACRDGRADTASGAIVVGTLNQFAAKAAACAGDGAETRSLLKLVFSGAERLGRDRGAYGHTFGLANAANLEVCTLVDLGRPREAAHRAEGIRTEWLGKVHRIGWRYMHQARAYGMLGQDDRALAAIAAGLRMAPELIRLEGTAARLVRDMLQRRRYAGEQLRRIAHDLRVDY